MQFNYSEVEGHVLAHRGTLNRDFSHVTHEVIHPLKQGIQMFASLMVLMSSIGLIFLSVFFVEDLQQHDTFSQTSAMAHLDRDFKSLSHHNPAYSHADLNL